MAPQLKAQGRRSFLEQTLRIVNDSDQRSSKFLKFLVISKFYRRTSFCNGYNIYRFIVESSPNSKLLLRFSSKLNSQGSSRASFGLDKIEIRRLFNFLKPELVQIDFSANNPNFFAELMYRAPGKLAVNIRGRENSILPLIDHYAEKITEVHCDVPYLPTNARFLPMKLDRLELCGIKSLNQLHSLLSNQIVKKLKLSFNSLFAFNKSENINEKSILAAKEIEFDVHSFHSLQTISKALSTNLFPQLRQLTLKASCFKHNFEICETLNLDRVTDFINKCNVEVQHLVDAVKTLKCKVDCDINFGLRIQHEEPATEIEQQLKSHALLKNSDIKVVKNDPRSTVDLKLIGKCGPINFILNISSRRLLLNVI